MTELDIAGGLLDGEHVLWSGAPRAGIMFGTADVVLIPFSLIFCGFALFWEYAVVSLAHAPFFFRLWGLPFILVGLYLVAGRFVLDSWLRGRTSYALTNQRILIFRPPPLGRLTALSLRQMPDMTLTENGNGSGTIRFGSAGLRFGQGRQLGALSPALDPAPQFCAVENAGKVFRQVQQAVRDAGA